MTVSGGGAPDDRVATARHLARNRNRYGRYFPCRLRNRAERNWRATGIDEMDAREAELWLLRKPKGEARWCNVEFSVSGRSASDEPRVRE